MPRFTGKQYPGALRDLREQRKLEADQRNAAHRSRRNLSTAAEAGEVTSPTGWVQIADAASEPRVRSAATRLLNAIFGTPTERQVQP